jgi:hypothetical protein
LEYCRHTNPRQQYGQLLTKVLRGLLRKYGYECAKVQPCLPEHKHLIREKLDLTNPDDIKADAIISFGSIGAQRGDTYEHCTVSDVQWIVLESEKKEFTGLTTNTTVVKDKILLKNSRLLTVSADTNLSRCANVSLLRSLCARGIFKAGSLESVISSVCILMI